MRVAHFRSRVLLDTPILAGHASVESADKPSEDGGVKQDTSSGVVAMRMQSMRLGIDSQNSNLFVAFVYRKQQ